MKHKCICLVLACLSQLSCSDAKSPPSEKDVPPKTGKRDATQGYPPPEASTKAFFPAFVFHDIEKHDQFVVDWYSKHLRAMNEPSLYDAARDTAVHQYRFLWLPTWGRPVAVRVEILPGGASLLNLTILSGSAGYAPGEVKSQRSIQLSVLQTRGLLDSLDSINYWAMPSQDDVSVPDGERYILEAALGGRYHLVDRWSPEGPFAEVCQAFLKLAELKTPVD